MTSARRLRPPVFAEAVACHRAGRLADAERLYRQAIAAEPLDAEPHNLLGVVLGQSGRATEAIESLRAAARLDRRNATVYHNLAMAYQTAGRHEEAVAAYLRALRIRPEYVEALQGLGGSLLTLGRLDDAEAICRRAARLAPDDAQSQANLGAVALARGDHAEAVERTRRAIALAPGVAIAHANLGTALLGLGDGAAAEAALKEALALHPDYADARNTLGLALLAQGRIDAALAAFEAALAAKPGDPDIELNLALAYRDLGYVTDVLETFRRVLDHDPANAKAQYGLGMTLIDAGEAEAALACHEAILAREPRSPGALTRKALLLDMTGDTAAGHAVVAEAIAAGVEAADVLAAWSRLGRKLGHAEAAASRLEAALGEPARSDAERRHLHFALAALYDEAGRWEDAFAHAEAGNALHVGALDPDAFSASVDALIGYFERAREAAAPRAGTASELPVFIVGMPRSGTSLVEQIVATHPQVAGGGERDDIPRIARELVAGAGGVPFPAVLDTVDADILDALADDYLARTAARVGAAARATDKLPYNFLALGLIGRLVPGARVIHCVREPLDTCLYCFFQDFARGNAQTYDLGRLGRYYRDYARLMAHWRETLGVALIEVRYEALVGDLEGESRRLIDFLGLPWDARCLRFHENRRLINTASYDQVRRPLYDRSVGRWRHYEGHLAALRSGLSGA